MIKVIFFCNFGYSPEQLLLEYKKMTPNNSSFWKSLEGVADIVQADVVVFLQGLPHGFNKKQLEGKKIICFPREPNYAPQWRGIHGPNVFTNDNHFRVVTNPTFIGKDFDFLSSLKYIKKMKKVSAVISNKKGSKDYNARRNFLIQLTKKYPHMCDIWGAGWTTELGTSYRGQLGGYHGSSTSQSSKYDGLINYEYSICIENCHKKNQFTEKFTDALLCWTIPIYYGCSNISEYFPKGSYYEIDILNPNCFKRIQEITSSPITQQNIDAMTEARQLILNKYNIWDAIHDKVTYMA